jgi:hypothetical protein
MVSKHYVRVLYVSQQYTVFLRMVADVIRARDEYTPIDFMLVAGRGYASLSTRWAPSVICWSPCVQYSHFGLLYNVYAFVPGESCIDCMHRRDSMHMSIQHRRKTREWRLCYVYFTTSLDVRSLPNVLALGPQMLGPLSTNGTLRFARLFSWPG